MADRDEGTELPDEAADDGYRRPQPRARVSLHAATWGTSVASIVEDVLAVDLAVTAPVWLAPGYEVASGADIEVRWEEATGPWLLPCTLGAILERDVPQWQLRPSGEATQEQRRRHARSSTESTIELVHERRAMPADLLDLSEAGMRCQLASDAHAVGVGDIVSGELELEGLVVTVQGEIRRVHLDRSGRQVAVAFEEVAPATADLLRRRVFAEQAAVRARTIT